MTPPTTGMEEAKRAVLKVYPDARFAEMSVGGSRWQVVCQDSKHPWRLMQLSGSFDHEKEQLAWADAEIKLAASTLLPKPDPYAGLDWGNDEVVCGATELPIKTVSQPLGVYLISPSLTVSGATREYAYKQLRANHPTVVAFEAQHNPAKRPRVDSGDGTEWQAARDRVCAKHDGALPWNVNTYHDGDAFYEIAVPGGNRLGAGPSPEDAWLDADKRTTAPVAVPDGGEQDCEAMDMGYICTLRSGHDGSHIAHDGHGFCVHVWPKPTIPPTHLEGTGEQTREEWRSAYGGDSCDRCGMSWDDHDVIGPGLTRYCALAELVPPAPESGGGELDSTSADSCDTSKDVRNGFICAAWTIRHEGGVRDFETMRRRRVVYRCDRPDGHTGQHVDNVLLVNWKGGLEPEEASPAPTAPDSAGELPALEDSGDGDETAQAWGFTNAVPNLALRGTLMQTRRELDVRERQLGTALRDLADTRAKLEAMTKDRDDIWDCAMSQSVGLEYDYDAKLFTNRRALDAEAALTASEAKLAEAEKQRDALLAAVNVYGRTVPLTDEMDLSGFRYCKTTERYTLATGKEPADA